MGQGKDRESQGCVSQVLVKRVWKVQFEIFRDQLYDGYVCFSSNCHLCPSYFPHDSRGVKMY